MKHGRRSDPSSHGRILTAAIVLLIAVSPAACRKEKKSPPTAPPIVSVVTVTQRDVPVTSEYVALTQSSHPVNVQAG